MNLLKAITVSILIASVDQVTKFLALSKLQHFGNVVNFIPGINWKLSFNTGAAFGFLASYGGLQRWFFILVTIIICGFIIKMLRQSKNLESLSLSLILGGAIGNLIDRLRLGFVIDFIDVYVQAYHWYTFNLADAAIVLGVILYIFIDGKSHFY